jgi:GDP-mannose 6-dehydrogenase
MHSSLLVLGGSDAGALRVVADLYASLPVSPTIVGLDEAEIIKCACNAFHALKIAFANEVGDLCGALGANGQEVMRVLAGDSKLNASAAYLRPGFAFGGFCLPKDTRTLTECARNLGLKAPLLDSILPANREHLLRAVERATDTGVRRVGVYGASFKQDTDDLRESPALALAMELAGRGKAVSLYDNLVSYDQWGSDRAAAALDPTYVTFVTRELWIRSIDVAILTREPDEETARLLMDLQIPVIDLHHAAPSNSAPCRAAS